MENTNNNFEKCRVIRDPKELNSEGCRFFVEADNTQETLISSFMLRWLSYGYDGANYFTPEQQDAIKKVVDAKVARERNDMASHILIHILLYSPPRRLKRLSENDSKCIKALLQCVDVGVDVRPVLPNLHFGSHEKGICNSRPIVVETCLCASLFFVYVATASMADAACRVAESWLP